MRNKNLILSRKVKDDEFYTQLSDVENEVKHYKEHFKDKVVYCNCDNPEWSSFFIYFKNNFNYLGLKKLISTHCNLNIEKDKIECVELSMNKDGILKETKTFLKGNGDFRNQECIDILKESDIVCTNPPFSLFREYIAQLIEYNKKFLIIGSMNAVAYKEIFSLIKENKIWIGVSPRNMKFYKDINKTEEKSVNACWYTNLTHKKINNEIALFKKYNEYEYPRYDNYNAIEVGKVVNIPYDYFGLMGVPITFLEKYNPNQFEIVRLKKGDDGKKFSIEGKIPYCRIIIKRKHFK